MKNILFLGLLLVTFVAQAQFTVETDTGDPIIDGDIVAFNQTGDPAGKLPFFINNTSSGPINMRVQFVSAVNADGSNMQFCITPTCYYSITIGESYPQEQGAMSLPLDPGEQSAKGNYFINFEVGNGTDIIEYVFKFYQVDNSDNEIGIPLSFTYRYDPSMEVRDTEKMDISVYPTVVEDMMVVNSNEELKMEVYNLLGSLVKSIELPRGKNEINMSDMASQVYLIRFKNENGDTQTKKVIVK